MLIQKGGHDEERGKQDRVLGVPNVGQADRGRRCSYEDKLRGGGEGGSSEATAVVQVGHSGGCGKGRSESGIFLR